MLPSNLLNMCSLHTWGILYFIFYVYLKFTVGLSWGPCGYLKHYQTSYSTKEIQLNGQARKLKIIPEFDTLGRFHSFCYMAEYVVDHKIHLLNTNTS